MALTSEIKTIYDITEKPGISTCTSALNEEEIKRETKKLINGKTLFKSNALGQNVLLGDVDIRLLHVDSAYQRVTEKIEKLLDRFDPSRMGAIIVSYRAGKLFVIDGAHRVTAAIMRGLENVFCTIYTNLDQVGEAELFATQNDATVNLTGMQRYEAERTYGSDNALVIEGACKLYKIEPCDGKYSQGHAPIKSLYNVVNQYKTYEEKRDIMSWVLETLCRMNWTQQNEGCSSYVLMAMKKIYVKGRIENTLNTFRENLINVCKNEDPRETCLLGRLNRVTGEDIRGWAMSELMGIATGEITDLKVIPAQDTE